MTPPRLDIGDDLLALAHLAKTGPTISHCPHEPHERQQAFLALDCDEALYGGAAAGGKSDALLMAALQYIHVAGYSAILFRRTYSDLRLPGALMDRARAWWLGKPGIRMGDEGKEWVFDCPGGGTSKIVFAYMESDKDRFRYSSAEFQFVAFDELTQFSEVQYRFMYSRLRRLVGAKVPIRQRGATNPGGVGHRWVGERFGIAKDGRQNSEWVCRNGKEIEKCRSAERPFVTARLGDNAEHVDVEAYKNSLAKLDPTTRDQLEKGLWILDEEGRVYRFDFERNTVGAVPNRDGWRRIFGVDLGASERTPTTAFVRLLWHEHESKTYVTRAWKEAGIIPSTMAERCALELEADPTTEIVMDEGALGKGYGNELRQRYSLPVIAAEKRDKLGYRKLLNGALVSGELVLVRGECQGLESEFDTLVWDASGTDVASGLDDHETDALLYAWRRSQAHRSQQAPGPRPDIGTPEWFAAEEEAQLRAELDAARERASGARDRSFWKRW